MAGPAFGADVRPRRTLRSLGMMIVIGVAGACTRAHPERASLDHTQTTADSAAFADSVRTADAPRLRAEQRTVNGHVFDVVYVDARMDTIGLHWRPPSGVRYGSLGALRDTLAARGRALVFATNAGMFDPAFRPVGLYVEEGETQVPLNTRDSVGNFYLRPNGVFYVSGDSVHVVETGDFARRDPRGVRMATQSGPLLVRDGHIHPAFRPGSPNRNLRSGVGVRDGHVAVFAISRGEVDFHTLATLYRDVLGCRDALFLDGAISRMHVPALRRPDAGGDFAGILSVSVPAAR